jgi:uncharacterized protein YegP (UPF0339 family)
MTPYVPKATIRIYLDSAGGWRWRLVTRNGRVVADSSEAYTRERDALRAATRIVVLLQQEPVRIETLDGGMTVSIGRAVKTL